MSFVAARSCFQSAFIWWCLPSSREKTVTLAGLPRSPLRMRRTNGLPREPVPPVTKTLLPSRTLSTKPSRLASSAPLRPALLTSRSNLVHDSRWPPRTLPRKGFDLSLRYLPAQYLRRPGPELRRIARADRTCLSALKIPARPPRGADARQAHVL